MTEQVKRTRTGALKTAYFNSIGLPGVQIQDSNGNNKDDPRNRTSIQFTGDARELFWQDNIFQIDNSSNPPSFSIIRKNETDGTLYSTQIGTIDLSGTVVTNPYNSNFKAGNAISATNVNKPNDINAQSFDILESEDNNPSDPFSVLRTLTEWDDGTRYINRVRITQPNADNKFTTESEVPNAVWNFDLEYKLGDGTKGNLPTTIETNGGTINGSNKNFVIPHPVLKSENTETGEKYYLRHTAIETAGCCVTYSGLVQLTNGSATVDIDAVCNMEPGTFESFTKSTITRMTTNESGFDPVKSSLNGNKLTITCSNPDSTDEVCWLISAHRNDPYSRKNYDSQGNYVSTINQNAYK